MVSKNKKKIFVGLSGGVDSSVTAALLKDQGYDVVGVFIKTWEPVWLSGECSWRQDRRDAMRVSAILRIPFIELDLEKEYKQNIAEYMIREYREGRTPNPDVMCNKYIKFGEFLKWSIAHGADCVATGHYARLYKKKTNIFLFEGVDVGKDQSYFLWTLSQKQLSHIIFPLGDFEKKDVRKLAKKLKLPTFSKKDSQGVCMLGDISMKEFLAHYISYKTGNVLDTDGNVIGFHEGVFFFTFGERHGFTITSKGINENPYFVVAKDVDRNTLTVSQTPHSFALEYPVLFKKIIVSNLNFICENICVNDNKNLTCRIRYRGEKKKCKISFCNIKKQIAVIELLESDATVTSGQSLVFYQDKKCLGGGIIV